MIPGLNEMLKQDFNIHIDDQDLLDEAFTQASYVNEHRDQHLKFYERLEFLGDAVLQLIVSEYIFKRYPKLPQGRLTRLRAAMVNEQSFSTFARECHFNKYIRLGKGEEKAGARDRDSLLCDIFESFVGALYLDQGKKVVEGFVQQVIFPKLDEGMFAKFFDHKTELQELAQADGPVDIDYELVDEYGPDNDRLFKVNVAIDDKLLGVGIGHSKKDAEQRAAQEALKHFSKREDNLV
ncbi:MAG: ribonuclease III [Lentilactobacillus hilgardii]|uniref:Ribonuclease 3 n=1 Tax=Lentilactobacillus hilgardii (strain ATCC 8290 / DSM 20176 / CCUG 30140 / JCM 1155 / KCTC 3500 / NBRC 15886 / NCIMB 8040 / NRRL B-1843 / 9) TaxID=1423757 RepID=C0XM52_LENH9|nr:ribonuclease III [Lentilactobacillus hilgardii]EEI18646.1 ribonuclease III [Lentilactobacillus buchneri ATCC 11577]EEI23591.1 ribonuclease III [Lentilactobacillus hilgardii DSM 20176 = ATCC 8290]MBZ2200863.1 ribonuclease III [Lentilactobacillus hilgardii]MBZ2204227.1 ribonuclease III [Lentilactobacillus hilgardii]MCT3397394.1 ribonuclease III [Lentilactobacillus hilgardii]